MLFAGSGWISALLSVGGEEIGFGVGLRDCGPPGVLSFDQCARSAEGAVGAEKREGLLDGPVRRNHLISPSPTSASLGVLEYVGKSILIRSCHISSTG